MKPLIFFVLVLIISFMTSCNKSYDDVSGSGDAIIVVKQSGISTVYGYALYAYTYGKFQSVKATCTLDPSKTYTLKINQEYKTNFYYEFSDDEFTTTKPTASTFNFSAVFDNGSTAEFQDEVSAKVLAVPVIKDISYDSTTDETNVTWSAVSGAESYSVMILKGSEVVFGSSELASTLRTYAVSSSTTGWITDFTPVAGDTYTVRLNAYLYEPSGNSYNLQAVSIAEETIVWGSN